MSHLIRPRSESSAAEQSQAKRQVNGTGSEEPKHEDGEDTFAALVRQLEARIRTLENDNATTCLTDREHPVLGTCELISNHYTDY